MADTYTIQFRRGMYADFDTSKIRPGEPVAILGNDPSVPSGKALYIAFAANDVRRLCSIEDISEMVNAGQFVGPQGPKGEKGDKGADGTVAFESLTPEQKESLRGISIKSASVDADGNLTITFSDGDSEDVGNIMGPQGIQGPKGDKGDIGPQGLKGDKGDKGPKGDNMSDEQARQIEQNKTDIASLKTETSSLKESISTKITKFYASSQGETHLADSDNGKIMDMMLYGKSEQKQYTGKNLLNYDAWKDTPIVRGTAIYENNGITLTATENDCYSEIGKNFPDNAKIKVSEGETLTLSWEESENKEGNIFIFGNGIANNGVVTDNRKSKKLSYTVPSGVTFITFRFGVTTAGGTISYKNIQIEKGSEPTTYEPYTGGIPSPNPDYPQEIKAVVNPKVVVRGKNLIYTNSFKNLSVDDFGTEFASNFRLLSDFIKVKSGMYTISNFDGLKFIGFAVYDEKLQFRNRIVIDSIGKSYSYQLSDCYVKLYFSKIDNKQEISIDDALKVQFELGSTPTAYEPYHEQTVTLPYTLNAIPVSSGGNVTIDGQEYVSDYVDVERGKLVRMVSPVVGTDSEYGAGDNNSHQVIINKYIKNTTNDKIGAILCDKLCPANANDVWNGVADNIVSVHGVESNRITFRCTSKANNMDSALKFIKSCKIYAVLATPEETDLTEEEIAALKALTTYYPTTNISVNSEQLDGYTVFNYPISMENGWNYVKQQIGDTRDYIYDMDARTQDTDLQAAEAYVNSEYAVALTELEI